jgi:hypothetical protein
MAQADDKNQDLGVMDLVQDPVITHTYAIRRVFTRKFLRAGQAWIVGERIDCRCEA